MRHVTAQVERCSQPAVRAPATREGPVHQDRAFAVHVTRFPHPAPYSGDMNGVRVEWLGHMLMPIASC